MRTNLSHYLICNALCANWQKKFGPKHRENVSVCRWAWSIHVRICWAFCNLRNVRMDRLQLTVRRTVIPVKSGRSSFARRFSCMRSFASSIVNDTRPSSREYSWMVQVKMHTRCIRGLTESFINALPFFRLRCVSWRWFVRAFGKLSSLWLESAVHYNGWFTPTAWPTSRRLAIIWTAKSISSNPTKSIT